MVGHRNARSHGLSRIGLQSLPTSEMDGHPRRDSDLAPHAVNGIDRQQQVQHEVTSTPLAIFRPVAKRRLAECSFAAFMLSRVDVIPYFIQSF